MSFKTWTDAGFAGTLPVIPPGAELALTFQNRATEIGKIPGRKLGSGKWSGLADWNTVPFDPKWETWDASIGLRAGTYPAVDIDITDAALAERIQEHALEHLGPAPCRTGNPPKRLLQYRTPAPFKRMRLYIRKGDAKHLIEVLGQGQQYLIEGLHAKTLQPYAWSYPPQADQLTSITAAQADQWLGYVADLLEADGWTVTREGAARETTLGTTSQDSLRGDPVLIAKILQELPNDREHFGGRDDYLRVGHAVKAALPDDPNAFDLWWGWLERWQGDTPNTREMAQGDWDRMKAPFLVGAPWLMEQARALAPMAARAVAQADFAEAIDSGPVAPTGAGPRAVLYSDVWFTDEMAKRINLKHCPELGGWHQWTGTHWAVDARGNAPHIVSDCLTEIADTVLGESRAGARTKVGKAGTITGLSALLKSHPAIARCSSDFDSDPLALNTPAGIINLKTGAITPHDADRWFTQITRVAPSDEPPTRWLQFMQELTGGDAELAGFLQRWAGYCLTGLMVEQKLVFLWGPGKNGKSVFTDALCYAMGNYAVSANQAAFSAGAQSRHLTELAGLQNARLVLASETDRGQQLAESRVKAWVAGDEVAARFMYGNEFRFRPVGKLMFIGNHEPKLSGADPAIERRFLMVPLTTTPKNVNLLLGQELQQEAGGILRWMLEGARLWLAASLAPPLAVVDRTRAYLTEEDALGDWMAHACTVTASSKATFTDLWASWKDYCQQNGVHPGRNTEFSRALESKGFAKRRGTTKATNNISYRTGITLRTPFTTED